MFKNIEILDKKKFKSTKFVEVDAVDVAKEVGIIPLGFNEIIDMTYFAPVIIMGNESNLEFVAFTGISSTTNIFKNEDIFMPMFPKTYPFVNMIVKDENEKISSVIGLDNGEYVDKKKKNFIFNKKAELQKVAEAKIEQLRELTKQREVSKKIVAELKDKDLLIEKDFKIKYKDEEKTILNKFYIIDRKKLIELDDTTLAVWARKGWMNLIDCHLKSLSNFQKVLASL